MQGGQSLNSAQSNTNHRRYPIPHTLTANVCSMRIFDSLRAGGTTRDNIKQYLARMPLGSSVVMPVLRLVLACKSPVRRRFLTHKVMHKLRITDPKLCHCKAEPDERIGRHSSHPVCHLTLPSIPITSRCMFGT